ncbi:MAG: tetratricopeptide repeat protein [Chloroflexota bacterium]|nr:tetratricopeptide repeat protein [Chloroflexota bacterium]
MRSGNVDALSRSEAVQLFLARTRARCPQFAVTPENAGAVAQLCIRLDGLPLAIELAAARMKVLSVEQIVERLGERFKLLSATGESVAPRHRSLGALLDWSYDLLSDQEQCLLRAVSVFSGGFNLRAAVSIYSDETQEYDVLDLISQLVDKSLVAFEEQGAQARYRLLGTVRQYALEKLQQEGEEAGMREKHLLYYVNFAEGLENDLLSARQATGLARLEQEHDNLRGALAWSAHGGVEPELGLRLAGSLVWFWYFRGYLSEARSVLESVILHASVLSDAISEFHIESGAVDLVDRSKLSAWAKVLSAAGAIAFLQGDYTAARSRLENGLIIWRDLDDRRGMAFGLAFLGRTLASTGDPRCLAVGEESAALFREVGEKWGLALALDFLGQLAAERGDPERAGALHAESLGLYREMGNRWGVALQLSYFGQAAYNQGDYLAARAHLEEAVAIQREVGDKWLLAWTLRNLAGVLHKQGENRRAESSLEESLAIFRELGAKEGLTENAPVPTVAFIAQGIAALAAGNEQELTRREIEVLGLLANGLTDAQIAERLYLSARTVQAHVRSIYSKLNINTRSAATRYALEHRMG